MQSQKFPFEMLCLDLAGKLKSESDTTIGFYDRIQQSCIIGVKVTRNETRLSMQSQKF
jgi:hypothetical protein